MHIYRGLSIPSLCSNVFAYRYDVEAFQREWRRLLEFLREGLVYLKQYIDGLEKDTDIKLDYRERILLVIDTITWLMKAPVYLDPLENTVLSPYKIYWYERIYEIEELYKKGVKSFIEFFETCKVGESVRAKPGLPSCEFIVNMINLANKMQKYYSEEIPVDGERVPRWIYVLGYPADTRPGYNSVSLLVHSLLVSGLSWAIAVNRGFSIDKALLLALAGILHDIGKPMNPMKHVEASKSTIEEYFADLLKDIIGDDKYSELITYVSKHHSKEAPPIVQVLQLADRLSAKERGEILIEAILGDEIRELAKRVIEKARKSGNTRLEEYAKKVIEDPLYPYSRYSASETSVTWEFWSSIGEDDYRRLTEKYSRETWGLRLSDKLRILGSKQAATGNDIGVLLIDIRGIQSIINSSLDLAIMAANSYFIDIWLLSHLPVMLARDEYKVPLSAFIINTGGKALLVVPRRISKTIKTRVSEKYNSLHDVLLKLDIVVAESTFDPNYYSLMKSLERKNAINKALANSESLVHHGLGDRCELCGIRQAEVVYEIFGEERRLCIECYVRRLVANNVLYHRHKLLAQVDLDGKPVQAIDLIVPDKLAKRMLQSTARDEKTKYILRYIVEYISGLPPLEKLMGRDLNYAVVSIDGNLTGLYMYLSPTFTSAIEKSFLVDFAMKTSIRSFIEKIKESLRDYVGLEQAYREALRVYLGLLYVGGDDAKLIIPAHLVPAFIIHVSREYHRLMGCTATLSIGVASGPTKHSVWGLNDASYKLLEAFAKELGRRYSIIALGCRKPEAIASIQVYNTETTSLLTGERVKSFMDGVKGMASDDTCKCEGIVYQALLMPGDSSKVPPYMNLELFYNRLADLMAPEESGEDLVARLIRIGYSIVANQCSEISNDELARACIEYYVEGNKSNELLKYGQERITRAKHFNTVIHELMSIYNKFRDTVSPLSVLALYARRQFAREHLEGKRRSYGVLSDMLTSIIVDRSEKGVKPWNDYLCNAPLLNYLFLIKVLGGGML